MKTIQNSLLTIALAVFAFAVMAPDAQAVPKNKVPGVGKKEDKSGPAGSPSNHRDGKKSYHQKKIGI